MIEQKKVYLRFGEIPKNERSINWFKVNRESISESLKYNPENVHLELKDYHLEKGVSVFEIEDGLPKITNTRLFLSLKSRVDKDNLKEEIYEVTGDVVGYGNDEEPLLSNVRVLGKSSLSLEILKKYILNPRFDQYRNDNKNVGYNRRFLIEKSSISEQVINEFFEYINNIKDLNRKLFGISLKDEKELQKIDIELWKAVMDDIRPSHKNYDIINKKYIEEFEIEPIAKKLLEIKSKGVLDEYFQIKKLLSEDKIKENLFLFERLDKNQKLYLVKNIKDERYFLAKYSENNDILKLILEKFSEDKNIKELLFENKNSSAEIINSLIVKHKFYAIPHKNLTLETLNKAMIIFKKVSFNLINEEFKTTKFLKIYASNKFINEDDFKSIVAHKNCTEEVLEAFLENKNFLGLLKDIPEKFKNEEICFKFLNKNVINFKYIPNKLRSERIFIRAIKDNIRPINIKVIPKTKRTENIYNALWTSNKFIYGQNKNYNEKLYKHLLFYSSLKKDEIIKMFKDNDIYAGYNGEKAIFPIKTKDGKIVGGYNVDLKENKKPELLAEISYLGVDNTKANMLAEKVLKSLRKEETAEEMEHIEI